MDLIQTIATLPENRMCETLSQISLKVVRRFDAAYGVESGNGHKIPWSAHEVVGVRLNKSPRRSKKLKRHVTKNDKIQLMAERFEQGCDIRNSADATIDDLPDDQGILSVWGPGAEPTGVAIVDARAA